MQTAKRRFVDFDWLMIFNAFLVQMTKSFLKVVYSTKAFKMLHYNLLTFLLENIIIIEITTIIFEIFEIFEFAIQIKQAKGKAG